MTFYSPLRYPGGKYKIVNYFKKIIEKNDLKGGVYIEPYAGGASVALSLLFEGYTSQIIINDIDLSIYAFWYSVLNKTEKLCELIKKTPINIKNWEKQKKIQKSQKNADLLSLGFSTFFLNRTNISGIINAGVIGGKEQKGKWKINSRYNKKELINKIKFIASHKDKIELHNEDAIKLIPILRKKLSEKTLFYLDPPYYTKGKELYFNYYEYKDHLAICKEINKIKKQKWILTYDNANIIKSLYSNYRHDIFSLNYSAGKTTKGEEVMFFSENLKIS